MDTKRLYPLFGLPLIAFNISAIAIEDIKMYPGALCQPKTNAQSIVRNARGALLNTGNGPQIWTCPIVRDRPGTIEGAVIVVSNSDATADVSCTLFSRMPTGQLVASETQATTGTGVFNLEYGSGDPNIDSQEGDGHYYFICTVPGKFGELRSGVIGYRVTENFGET
jgi:hypothetical protein